jgi:hypothetical protein
LHPELPPHVLQHPHGLVAHLPNILRYHDPRAVPLPRPPKASEVS